MKHFFHIVLLLLSLAHSAFAQRSVVFLDQHREEEGRANRPRPGVYRKEIPKSQVPQTIGTSRTDFPNINISQYLLADQNETAVAVNPGDANNIIVGCNDYRSFNTLWFFSSLDGGYTWKAGSLPENQALYTATDPSVGFGPDGIAFYGNGRVASDGFPYPINDVVVYKSTTKGDSWNPAVRVILDSIAPSSATKLADKYYIAVAPTSFGPLPPRVYMAWAEYIDGKSRIVASASGDAGATWSVPVAITALGKFQAPVPVVATGGEVYITFIDLDVAKREILFSKSTDNGSTFSTPKKIANYQDLGPRYPLGDSFPHPVIKGHLRVNSFPSIAVDHSFKHFNRIYTTWAGKGQDGRPHIYLSKSDDFGSTWSEALPIENDKSTINTDKFFPWIAVDPTTGLVGICFYDSRLDAPTNELIDLFMGISEDGGESFSVRRISDASFDPGVSRSLDSIQVNGDTMKFFGDYNGLAAFNGMWYPVWTDSRVGYDQDIYIGIVDPRLPEAVRKLEVHEESGSAFPILSWEHSGLTTFGSPLGAYEFHIERNGGKEITLPSTYRTFRDSSAQIATSYTYKVSAVASSVSSIVQEVMFVPLASRTPLPPVVVTSVAEPTGFSVNFKIPTKNIADGLIHDLHYLYYRIDDVVVDSFKLNDGMRGNTLGLSFTADVGYHKFQIAASTRISGETVTSDFSQPVWLYAGTPRETYAETFEGTKDIFTISAWDVTSESLPSHFINDSLPNVPYSSGVNTWFLLPPVHITDAIHTLEFDHRALVALNDSALIELSLNNGVSYFPVRRFTLASEPLKWQHALTASESSGDSIALKSHIDKDVIARFRLTGTNTTAEDGWFVDNIRFTDKLTVSRQWESALGSLNIYPSVLAGSEHIRAELELHQAGLVTVRIVDLLGRTVAVVTRDQHVSSGSYVIDCIVPGTGAYVLEAVVTAAGRAASVLRGRFIVQK